MVRETTEKAAEYPARQRPWRTISARYVETAVVNAPRSWRTTRSMILPWYFGMSSAIPELAARSAMASQSRPRELAASRIARRRYAADETDCSTRAPRSDRRTFSPTVAASLREAQGMHMSKSQSLQRQAPPWRMGVEQRSHQCRQMAPSKTSGCAWTCGRKRPAWRVSSVVSSRARKAATLMSSTLTHMSTTCTGLSHAAGCVTSAPHEKTLIFTPT
mmetsp:Transcript_28883/g.99717  ORF Transcript_28883/g.99717 Transcript_28883/m.99717 type:complete len:218 (-) Transcript_28883:265-918(-)